MKWFRNAPSPHQLALAMIGAKPGARVLVVGTADATLAGALGIVTGLNGTTTVAELSSGAAARVEAAAREAGALLEFVEAPATKLPDDFADLDIVVFSRQLAGMTGWDRAGACGEAVRVLRPGGRLIVIETGKRPGLFGLFSSAEGPQVDVQSVLDLLQSTGFRASRLLGDADGVVFIEAVKPRGQYAASTG